MIPVRARLAAFMFLCFFVPGSFITFGLVMAKQGMADQIGNAASCTPLATLISPLLIGYWVDRYLSPERAMVILQLLGAVALAILPYFLKSGNIYGLISVKFAWALCFMPTYSLMNNIAFSHIDDVDKMPYLRLFSNVGWVLPGFVISFLDLSASPSVIYIGAIASLALALISFTLPPKKTAKVTKGNGVSALRAASELFRNSSFVGLLIGLTMISVTMSFYYAYVPPYLDAVGNDNVGATLAVGQISEVAAVALLPLLLGRGHYKWIVVFGAAGWLARYALFTLGAVPPNPMIVFLGIAIHGICWDFLFVTASIFTEKAAPVHAKAQAQAIVVFFTQGIGMLAGAQISGLVYTSLNPVKTSGLALPLWQQFWTYPAAIAAAALLVVAIWFRPGRVSLPGSISENNGAGSSGVTSDSR